MRSNYAWQVTEASAVHPDFIKTAQKEGLTEELASLVFERGIQTKEDLQNFLNPRVDLLHDPYLLHDMKKAVHRIRKAIEQGEQILVYGDYDADGMTSAAIMKEALEELGAECLVYLPNRFTDGYGPNQSVYKYFIDQMGVSLIVTVDNGVAGVEAIAYAASQGVDVIVTDHHAMPDQLPDAYAIVHPEHPDASYPFPFLAGCGVAFKVATALLETVQMDFLELVAIGTIADMVSLTDENRMMVSLGLQLLQRTQRIGLQELFQVAGIAPENLDEETIGFQIAPRLNALGRLDDPNPAVDLLTGFDEEEARELALMIDQKNLERKNLVQTVYEEAKALLRPDRPVQVLAKEGWNPGILGIVAGRLLEELHQPIIVLSIEDGRAKGSARSPETVNIFEALKPHRDLFMAFGGHAGAAGMTLEVAHLDQVAQILIGYIQKEKIDLTQKEDLLLDGSLKLNQLSIESVKAFRKIGPFGMNFRKPIYCLRDFTIESAKSMGEDNQHLKIRVRQDNQLVDVLAFGWGGLAQEITQVKGLELAVHLSLNQWNGQTSLQLQLVDMRVEGIQLFDIRKRTIEIPYDVPVWTEEEMGETDQIALDLLPDDLNKLKQFLRSQDLQAIYFKNRFSHSYYIDGYGTREQFSRLYKTIYQYPEFDVRYKLKDLATYLHFSQELLIKMIQIFQELGFVEVVDGVMRVNKEAKHREIDESQIYQNLKALVKQQEILALGTVQEIYDYLMSDDEK
nr:single-stranded-DNA-specific exonuclease RecJ [Streptococcus sp. DD13]